MSEISALPDCRCVQQHRVPVDSEIRLDFCCFFLLGRSDQNKLFFVMAAHHGLMLQHLRAVGFGCHSLPGQVLLLLFSVLYS